MVQFAERNPFFGELEDLKKRIDCECGHIIDGGEEVRAHLLKFLNTMTWVYEIGIEHTSCVGNDEIFKVLTHIRTAIMEMKEDAVREKAIELIDTLMEEVSPSLVSVRPDNDADFENFMKQEAASSGTTPPSS